MSSHSVDGLLAQVESDAIDSTPVVKSEPVEVQESKPDQDIKDTNDQVSTESDSDEVVAESKPDQEIVEPTDEYGNEIPKPRTYTEEELNRILHDRTSRYKQQQQQQQPTQQQQQQAADAGFKYNENSEETWETQLKSFVKHTINEVSNEQSEAQWRQTEQNKQQEFESKFTSGASRYQDFEQVVSSQPLTPHMMMATRGMDNPAAFVYAASKQHPQELTRISQMNDPYQQALEIGKLEERMKKGKAVTKAPKIVPKTGGEIPTDRGTKRSVDDMIRMDGQREMKRRKG